MNYANVHPAFTEALTSLARSPASARRDHAAFTTYLDAADALASLLKAGELRHTQRPSIDRRAGLWWITHE